MDYVTNRSTTPHCHTGMIVLLFILYFQSRNTQLILQAGIALRLMLLLQLDWV